ncbi:N-acetylmuramoyl-L-alanine amidase [Cellulosilyticum sp. I15G10I2]|uniref:N-acetylmuramoyl-L-alanine amidase n=1 Tax=Cellulosilyticum sp. I15G10I2 TaxID=1892843 RepID=UPI00085BFAC8|nr:N-acetylmuramoyl-L-alanine amidase [Cellulosilyticum sp. I15G10I2]
MKILIDPGHRNNSLDYGATGNGQKESALALQISKRLKLELEKHKIICFLTRESEEDTISVSERPRKAQALGVDLLISIHINSAANISANGIEVLYKHENILGKKLCDAMCRVTGANNRGAKLRNDLGVLNGFRASVLVECGFISNYRDCTLLKDNIYQERIAKAIADVIVSEYKIVVTQHDVPLINAVSKLVRSGVNINEASWNNIDRMNLMYAQALIEKIGALFGATNYFASIDALVEKGIIGQRKIWDDKQFKTEYIRSLLIKVASKI